MSGASGRGGELCKQLFSFNWRRCAEITDVSSVYFVECVFCVISFVQSLGIDRAKFQEEIPDIQAEISGSSGQVRENMVKILSRAISMREESTRGKYRTMIQAAVEFMEEHYSDESLNLNKVACAANVSANHFSALFSQEMKQTFIEYLTALRMRKARELLRCTD